jgi:glycerol-3-phosphate dehydrogenase (NAD(P)+)
VQEKGVAMPSGRSEGGHVAVIGAGSWGTTVAALLALRRPTVLWARRVSLADAIRHRRQNPDYLPGITLPDALDATASLLEAANDASMVVMAVPSHGFRAVLVELVEAMRHGTPVVSLTKGFEQGTQLRMSQVVAEVAPASPVAVVTGPNLAREVARGMPAATVVASENDELAAQLQELLSSPTFRVYTNPDVVGCEVAGATKNVVAIAAGVAAGLGLGESTLAALVTRGLAEMGRLGVALGADQLTFAGLAGVGDLVATCTSPQSRNRHVGVELGRGRRLGAVLTDMRMVAEGVRSARPIVELAHRLGVEMPIATQVVAVLEGRTRTSDAIAALMQRRARSEFARRPERTGVEAHAHAPIPAPADARASMLVANGTRPERQRSVERLVELLRRHGVPEEEITQAFADHVVDLLVADCLVVPARARYTRSDVEHLTGMSADVAERFWRALGFPALPPEEPALTDLDLEAVRLFQAMARLGAAEVDSALELARVIGSAMARIAEAQVFHTRPGELAVGAVDSGGDTSATVAEASRAAPASGVPGAPGEADDVLAAERFVAFADQTLPAMARLLEFVWRRHVQAALRRAAWQRRGKEQGAMPELTVGFADMVGFTVLSQQLSEDELAAVVSRFEAVAHDTVATGGGRVVKMIGDEVMFVAEDPVAAATIALALADAYADDELLADVRVGLATGPVLVQDGDYFGPVVNLAKRIVDVANPGSVVVSESFRDALASAQARPAGAATGSFRDEAGAHRPEPGHSLDEAGAHRPEPGPPHDEPERSRQEAGADQGPAFALDALRPRHLKDFGRVQLFVLLRAGSEPPSLDRRLGQRLERLAQVLSDLDELRERGERLLAHGLGQILAERLGRDSGLGPLSDRGAEPSRS